MKTLSLTNNDQMPALGLGTWKSEPGEVYNAVKEALKVGYRHVDCAPIYGNEKEIGPAFKESFKDGVLKREDLWVTSKLWNDNHAAPDVIPALEQTLADLQLDYLDLFLIHWPIVHKKGVAMAQNKDEMLSLRDVPLSETWAKMEEAVQKGLAKHIGVCNFGIVRLQELMATSTINPEVNQVESHPYLQQNELLEFCNNHNIIYTAYSPLGSADRPAGLKGKDEVRILDDPSINEIAKKLNASAAQVLIAWALQRETSVIPKSVNPARIRQNFDASSLELSDDDMNAIASLDKGMRYVSGEFWVLEGGPYSIDDVWA